MGSIYFSLILAVTLLITAKTSFALYRPFAGTLYIVGDDNGWTNGYDYQLWASGKQFFVGDSLVFEYTQEEHNVFEVDQAAFDSCTIPPISNAWTTGYDVITFGQAGGRWFICGVDQHCAADNQKFYITVQ